MQAQAQLVPHRVDVDPSAEIDAAEVTPKDLGDPQEDLVFIPLTSVCRIADTRLAGGPVVAGTSRDFKGTGNFTLQGGAVSCGLSSSTSVVVMNVAVVQPAANGSLTIHPFGVTRPDAETMHYTAGKITRNELITKYGSNAL